MIFSERPLLCRSQKVILILHSLYVCDGTVHNFDHFTCGYIKCARESQHDERSKRQLVMCSLCKAMVFGGVYLYSIFLQPAKCLIHWKDSITLPIYYVIQWLATHFAVCLHLSLKYLPSSTTHLTPFAHTLYLSVSYVIII